MPEESEPADGQCVDALKEAWRTRLAGRSSARWHRNPLAPRLSYGRHQGPPGSSARPAAVLLALWPAEQGWSVPLTVRPRHLPRHSGQVSLPGGAVEGEETTQAAAIRETEEELGVRVDPRNIVGRLPDLYLYNSDYVVTPWIAVLSETPRWAVSQDEVEELFHLPLDWLRAQQQQKHRVMQIRHGELSLQTRCLRYGKHTIWGATAMILAEFAWGPF